MMHGRFTLRALRGKLFFLVTVLLLASIIFSPNLAYAQEGDTPTPDATEEATPTETQAAEEELTVEPTAEPTEDPAAEPTPEPTATEETQPEAEVPTHTGPEREGRQLITDFVAEIEVEIPTEEALLLIQELGYACEQVGVCVLEIPQAELGVLKANGFVYQTVAQAVVIAAESASVDQPLAEEYQYGSNFTDWAIEDADEVYCGLGYSDILISGAPAGSTVTRVEYSANVVHTWVSDLALVLTNDQATEVTVYEFLGSTTDGGFDDDAADDYDIYLDQRVLNTEFDGQLVNQYWYLLAYDCAQGDTGYIDSFEIWLYYEYVAPEPDIDVQPTSLSYDRTIGGGGGAASFDSLSVQPSAPYETLAVKAQDQGTVRVIVQLAVPFTPEGDLIKREGIDAANAQIDSISAAQDDLLNALSPRLVRSVKRMNHTPYVALEVGVDALEALYNSPLVASVQEDVPVPPSLDISVPMINADDVWAEGYTGAGQTVAILDSGVDGTHPFLTGKVVSEACYSTTDSGVSNTLCPNGLEEQVGTGAGVSCGSIDGCDHGTHVAGIATGNGTSFDGVAPDANVIAIQVFSEFTTTEYCSSPPCILTYSSDQILALERVYDLRDTYDIASVNMSLGGGNYTATCDGDSRKTIIDTLRSVGIATVIASGNNGYTNALNAPGCISSAVTVGATTSHAPADQVAGYSNSASFLDLLAPGSDINSSVPGGGYESWNGTSMATPHVAGAWALFKEAAPDASVDSLLSILEDTGVPILDTRNSITKPRINLQAAFNTLMGDLTITNTGTASLEVSSITVVGSSCWLSVSPNSSISVPAGESTTIEVTIDENCVGAGSYNDTLRIASNDPDENPVDVPVSLNVEQLGLPAPTSLGATTISQTQINLGWIDNSSDETTFHIERSPNGTDSWAEIDTVAANAVSYSDTSLTCNTPYYYRVRAYRSSDTTYSEYSNIDNATTSMCLVAPSLVSPTDTATIDQMHPVLSWDIPAWTPEQYNVVIEPAGGGTAVVDVWVSAASVCVTNCTWTTNTALPETSYQWKVRGYTAGVGASEFSSNWTFTIDSTVDLIDPNAGETVDFLKPTFTWNEPSWSPAQYNVVVEPFGGGAALINAWVNGGTVCSAGECSWTPSSYLSDGDYQWRVQAYTSGYGASTWSETRALSVASTPTPQLPVDGSTTDLSRPELAWKELSWVEWYQVEITPDGEAPLSRWVNASACAAGTCTWAVNFTMADTAYDWRVRGYTAAVATGYWSNSAALIVQPIPQLSSPANGAIVDDPKPELTWSALSWAENYLVEVYDSGLGLTSRWLAAADVCSAGVCSYETAFTLPPDNYTWRVLGYTAGMPTSPWSDTWSMVMASAPALISPDDEAIVDMGRPTFSWDELSWAEWYELVIEPQGGGTPILSAWLEGSALCSSGTCSWPVYITLSDGNYQWKVRGYTAAYAVGAYSDSNAMTIQKMPQLISPVNGATVTVSQPTLSWEAMSWVTHYEVLITPQGGGTSVDRWVDQSVICTAGTCTWQVDVALSDDDYTWQVRGYNASTTPTTSPWSAVRNLTVDVP